MINLQHNFYIFKVSNKQQELSKYI